MFAPAVIHRQNERGETDSIQRPVSFFFSRNGKFLRCQSLSNLVVVIPLLCYLDLTRVLLFLLQGSVFNALVGMTGALQFTLLPKLT